jgi:hypothetical protein
MIIKKGIKTESRNQYTSYTLSKLVLDDKKVYTILEIISFHYERHTIQGDRINNWPNYI